MFHRTILVHCLQNALYSLNYMLQMVTGCPPCSGTLAEFKTSDQSVG